MRFVDCVLIALPGIASQQGFDERFELVHASRGLEAFHDIALS